MAKPSTILVKLESSADTGYYYVTKKNPRTQTEKLSFRKYDPVVIAQEEREPAPPAPQPVADPTDGWTNKQLSDWCQKRHINIRSRNSITEFADEHRIDVPDPIPSSSFALARKIVNEYLRRGLK